LDVVRTLSKLYSKFNQTENAIHLYEGAVEADRIGPVPNDVDDYDEFDDNTSTTENYRIGHEQLADLADLYIQSLQYEKAVHIIKECSARLVGQSISDAFGEDTEFDNLNIPLEIRVKLGVCRLWLDQEDLAKVPFIHTNPIETICILVFIRRTTL
jgi:general transcription factor 3C polypeptide 3 (transcription factor C subunit 4)